MLSKKELENKNWKNELIQLMRKEQSIKKSINLIREAQLKPHHYRILYEWFMLHGTYHVKLFHFPWQFQILTGEACYLMPHLFKKDANDNTAAHYTVMAGAGSTILEKIRNKQPSLLNAVNLQMSDLVVYAFAYKNKQALRWLLKEMPEFNVFDTSHPIWEFEKYRPWPEGNEFLSECCAEFNLPINLYCEPFNPSITLFRIYTETLRFPLIINDDFHPFFAALQSKWKLPISKFEWCKDNIPDFIEILKNVRNKHGSSLPECIFDQYGLNDFFSSMIKESPELLDIENDDGCSLFWYILNDNWENKNSVNFIFSWKKDPSVISGIFIDDEADLSQNESDDNYNEHVRDCFWVLNNILIHNYSIQSLFFDERSQNFIAEYCKFNEPPLFYVYLERNRLLPLLLLCLKDEDCTFLSYLNLDLMKNIIQNFIALTPPVPKGSFFEGLGFFKTIYCEHKEKEEIIEQKSIQLS